MEVVPRGGAEERARSPPRSSLPLSAAEARGPGPTQPPGPASLHPHPSPSFPPPLTEPEPAARQRGFRPGADRKAREPPGTGTVFTGPEDRLAGAEEERGWGKRSKSELRARGTPARVARPEKPRERLTLVSIPRAPCQTGVFLFVALGEVLVRPPSFGFLCPSAP